MAAARDIDEIPTSPSRQGVAQFGLPGVEPGRGPAIRVGMRRQAFRRIGRFPGVPSSRWTATSQAGPAVTFV